MGLFAAKAPTGPDPRSIHGAARVAAGLVMLQAWARDARGLPEGWDRWELPLLEALPDCPPALKPTLAQALDDCARACRHRETARRLITFRNGLLP